MSSKIYLDYAATTPVDPEVLEKMIPYFKEEYGNPSSLHQFGQAALRACDKARDQVADFLNCSSSEIIFTGSATEANNLALFGVKKATKKNPHIITSPIEHHAVLNPIQELKDQGAEVTYLPISSKGIVQISDIKKAIKKNTVLVSVMYANNEIGTIQPIPQIGKLIKKINSKSLGSPIYFHTDAVQAINYLDCDVEKLGVDLLSLSGHKIYGPKGVGALYLRKNTPLKPLIYGGGHEQGRRSGTENVPAIVGLGEAVSKIEENKKEEIQRLKPMREKLIDGILKQFPEAQLNGSRKNRLSNNVNVTIPGAEGESMVLALDQKGIAVSTGSACSTKTLEPSHVLLAIGLSPQEAHSSLRLTLGKYSTSQQIDKVLKVLGKVVKRLRKISGYRR